MLSTKDMHRPQIACAMSDEDAVTEITSVVKLATQAMDGAVLSDSELDDLCDAALCKPLDLAGKQLFLVKAASLGRELPPSGEGRPRVGR